MEQTAAIQKVSDDACFRFLYPMVKGGINPMRMLDKDLMARRMQADADMMRAAGFERVTWKNYTGGIAAVHVAFKPADEGARR